MKLIAQSFNTAKQNSSGVTLQGYIYLLFSAYLPTVSIYSIPTGIYFY